MLIKTWKPTCMVLVLLTYMTPSAQADLLIGTATTSITPNQPVAVSGQFRLRIAKNVESPVTANVIALESRDGAASNAESKDIAIFVSCDLVYITAQVRSRIRSEVHRRLPDLDTSKIILNATHTHTAPVTTEGKYPIPKEGVIQVNEYVAFLSERVADAIVTAWKGRKPGSVSWGLSDAVVAYNRRAVYANGKAQMYGRTNGPDFRGLEGYEDHDINTLFFCDQPGTLVGMLVNVSCPTQEVESRSTVNADFWHPAREALHKQYGEQVCILGSVGAAGDQSPHLMYRKAADERMRRLRGLTRLEEIARRVVRAVNEAYEVVKNDRHTDVPLIHKVQEISLPMRIVTDAEYVEAKAEVDKVVAAIKENPNAAKGLQMRMKWYGGVVKRYEQQKTNPEPTLEVEIHAIRIGDVAVCTNRFELFTDFGICMKARSKAIQTIVIQLAGPGTYLPTEKAVRGGHYSAIVESNLVGPEGGHILVDRTVELINSMWKSSK